MNSNGNGNLWVSNAGGGFVLPSEHIAFPLCVFSTQRLFTVNTLMMTNDGTLNDDLSKQRKLMVI